MGPIDRSGSFVRLHAICGCPIWRYTILIYLGIPDMRSKRWVCQQEHYTYGHPTHCWLAPHSKFLLLQSYSSSSHPPTPFDSLHSHSRSTPLRCREFFWRWGTSFQAYLDLMDSLFRCAALALDRPNHLFTYLLGPLQ